MIGDTKFRKGIAPSRGKAIGAWDPHAPGIQELVGELADHNPKFNERFVERAFVRGRKSNSFGGMKGSLHEELFSSMEKDRAVTKRTKGSWPRRAFVPGRLIRDGVGKRKKGQFLTDGIVVVLSEPPTNDDGTRDKARHQVADLELVIEGKGSKNAALALKHQFRKTRDRLKGQVIRVKSHLFKIRGVSNAKFVAHVPSGVSVPGIDELAAGPDAMDVVVRSVPWDDATIDRWARALWALAESERATVDSESGDE